MTNKINRSKADIFSIRFLGYIFKNKQFIFLLRCFVLFLLISAIASGFMDNSKQNSITSGIFWGIFWPFFTIITLSTFGGIFCGICPHAFIGKYLNRIGPKRKMPSWMRNRWIGLSFLLVGYWAINYSFNRIFQSPVVTSIFFLFFTFFAIFAFYLYRNMDYCKYLCPFSAIRNAFSKISFAFLSTYAEECTSCQDQSCHKVCKWNLNPRGFEKKVNMQDCTLCMDCAQTCEAVKFSFVKPGFSLAAKNIKGNSIDIWVYLLLTASLSYTMMFLHVFGRSRIGEYLPWTIYGKRMAELMPSIHFNFTGLFALLFSIIIVLIAGPLMIRIGSKIVGLSFKDLFYNIGYGYAPLVIIGTLNHVFQHIFITYIPSISNAFIQLFHIQAGKILPLVERGNPGLLIFSLFDYLAIFWTIYLLYKRSGFLDIIVQKRWVLFILASMPAYIFLFNKLFVIFIF